MGVAQRAILALIWLYKHSLAYLIGGRCRFYPSCSDYGWQAVTKHGAWRGAGLTVRRIGRCHPWHPGGYDPVPELTPQDGPGDVARLATGLREIPS